MKYPQLVNHIIYENFNNDINSSKLITRAGESFSGEKLKDFSHENFVKFSQENFKNILPTTPHIIYTGCGSSKYFETKKYNKNTIELLNKKGLEIFLYEELSLATGNKLSYYLEVSSPDDPIFFKNYGSFIQGFETSPENLKLMYSFELESIKQFVKNNNLTSVTVNCCEYNVEKYLQNLYPTLKIQNNNLYINFLKNKSIKNKKIPSPNQISKKFLSLNNKYKGYRHLMSAYLYSKDSKISFDHNKAVYGNLKNHLWFDLNDWKITYPKYFTVLSKQLIDLKHNNPLVLDTSGDIPNPNFNTEFDYTPNKFFQQCFCSVITETFYSKPVTSLTEKTLNAIENFHPFILVAPPYTLDHLKSCGFKSFSDYWDESYNEEENHEKRLIKIFKLIDDLDSKSISELKYMYNDMKPILEHNYKTLTLFS